MPGVVLANRAVRPDLSTFVRDGRAGALPWIGDRPLVSQELGATPEIGYPRPDLSSFVRGPTSQIGWVGDPLPRPTAPPVFGPRKPQRDLGGVLPPSGVPPRQVPIDCGDHQEVVEVEPLPEEGDATPEAAAVKGCFGAGYAGGCCCLDASCSTGVVEDEDGNPVLYPECDPGYEPKPPVVPDEGEACGLSASDIADQLEDCGDPPDVHARTCDPPSSIEIDMSVELDELKIDTDDPNHPSGVEIALLYAARIFLLENRDLIEWLACGFMDAEMASCLAAAIDDLPPISFVDAGSDPTTTYLMQTPDETGNDEVRINYAHPSWVGWLDIWGSSASNTDKMCVLLDLATTILHELVHFCDECDESDCGGGTDCSSGSWESASKWGTEPCDLRCVCEGSMAYMFTNAVKYSLMQRYPCLLDSCCALYACSDMWLSTDSLTQGTQTGGDCVVRCDTFCKDCP